jgi:hypothetical protein
VSAGSGGYNPEIHEAPADGVAYKKHNSPGQGRDYTAVPTSPPASELASEFASTSPRQYSDAAGITRSPNEVNELYGDEVQHSSYASGPNEGLVPEPSQKRKPLSGSLQDMPSR